MAQLKLGSRHNKAAKRVVSTVNQDGRIDQAKADKVNFFGTEDKPAFTGEAWIPYLAAGNVTKKEHALTQIGTLIDELENMSKADSLLVESYETESDGKPKVGEDGKPIVKVRYNGPVAGKLSAGKIADRNVLAGAENGTSAAAYVCNLIKDALTLAHQQEMNGIIRKEMMERARTQGLLKAKGASTGRSRSEDIA